MAIGQCEMLCQLGGACDGSAAGVVGGFAVGICSPRVSLVFAPLVLLVVFLLVFALLVFVVFLLVFALLVFVVLDIGASIPSLAP